jgi:hypothetical protein
VPASMSRDDDDDDEDDDNDNDTSAIDSIVMIASICTLWTFTGVGRGLSRASSMIPMEAFRAWIALPVTTMHFSRLVPSQSALTVFTPALASLANTSCSIFVYGQLNTGYRNCRRSNLLSSGE